MHGCMAASVYACPSLSVLCFPWREQTTMHAGWLAGRVASVHHPHTSKLCIITSWINVCHNNVSVSSLLNTGIMCCNIQLSLSIDATASTRPMTCTVTAMHAVVLLSINRCKKPCQMLKIPQKKQSLASLSCSCYLSCIYRLAVTSGVPAGFLFHV